MSRKKNIEDITDEELDEQIELYQEAHKDAVIDKNYAAPNTYPERKALADALGRKLKKLTDRKEALS